MVNTIREGDRNLVRLDYSSLLAAILADLQNKDVENPFRISNNGKQLFINIDEIAYRLATTKGSQIQSPLGSQWKNTKVATTHLAESSKDSFINYNRRIRDCLQQHLESVLKDKKYESIEKYLLDLRSYLTEFKGKTSNQISLNYDFEKKYSGLSKQRLTLTPENEDSPLLKFHRLTITIKNTQGLFDLQLKDSLNNYINCNFNNKSKDELEEILEDLYTDRDKADSDWYALKRLMDTEAIAKVQRTAKIKYLEYLLELIGEHNDAIYLEVLISRLQALERYIDDPNKGDGDYQVSYESEDCNLKEIFSRAEAFDYLPIIPLIDGNLGEIRDDNKGALNFIFGLKLKLGGKVQTEGGKTVLEYYLDLINPDSDSHKAGLEKSAKKNAFTSKIIKIAVLYFFVFAGNDPTKEGYTPELDLEYDVINIFEEKILSVFKKSNQENKRDRLSRIIQYIKQYNTEYKISKLKELLTNKLKKPKLWNSRIYPIHINIKQGVLETEANVIDQRNKFFKADLNSKAALKYISVSDSSADQNSLCYLSGDIQIDEIGYFETPDNQEFSMEYATGKFPALPIILVPREERCRKIFAQNLAEQKSIVFPYHHERLQKDIFQEEKSLEAFIYRFTFSLLTYISLKILLDTATEQLKTRFFIPILRLHLGDKQNPHEEEVFMRSTFVTLSHLFNINHRSSCQGFLIENINSYKLRNGLSSLYSVLPKKFKLNNPPSHFKVEKLAIVVVSSRECDRSWKGDYKKSNLIGEVIKIQRQGDGSILVYTSKTISEHYDNKQLYSDPDAVVREVEQLYKDGYKHILYIAKSPYSQTLNLTDTENENLYFMSSQVIRNLKGDREDLKIYPVFFDKYYVVSLQNLARQSLYIQDAEELTNIVNDPTKQIAIFFNLFNGIKVGGSDKYYNGVMSYSTLLNVYDQKLLDTNDIYAGLIDNDENRGLKNEILQFLTLFHFSRYEASIKDIQLKLDPYQNIIGDESVGALSMFPHVQPKVKFNCLAFLNEVTDALDAKLPTE